MKPPIAPPAEAWHGLSVDATLAYLESSPRGLAAAEAASPEQGGRLDAAEAAAS